MQSLLIGIDPPENVKKEIYRLKSRVVKFCGSQQQVNEPPHCTFVVNNFTDKDSVDRILERIAKDFHPFDIATDKIAYFPPEDSSGLYMVHFPIQKTKELERLQEKVVIETSKYSCGCLLKEYLQRNVPGYKYTQEELTNIEKYGYLYVGRNLKPHISMAILDPKCFGKIGKEIMSCGLTFQFPFTEVTLFTYDGSWKPYKKFNLG